MPAILNSRNGTKLKAKRMTARVSRRRPLYHYMFRVHPWGRIWLMGNKMGLTAIGLGHRPWGHRPSRGFFTSPIKSGALGRPLLAPFAKKIRTFLKGRARNLAIPHLFLNGTPFQQRIWRALKKIPYGETQTYGWLAKKVGNPSGARAVGQALSQNPLPLIFPCHRIVTARVGDPRVGDSSGKIGGFSAGICWKKMLLNLERKSS